MNTKRKSGISPSFTDKFTSEMKLMINIKAQTQMKTKNTIESVLYFFSSKYFSHGNANNPAKAKMTRTPRTITNPEFSLNVPKIKHTNIAAITKINEIETDEIVLYNLFFSKVVTSYGFSNFMIT